MNFYGMTLTLKKRAENICERFGKSFRNVAEVQRRFQERPMPDEALCVLLREYKDRGLKGYDLTEQLFSIIRENFDQLEINGPERAGRDILLGDVLVAYPKPDRPVDFVLAHKGQPVAIGFARYDSDRGGAQEDDRIGQYRECANEVLNYARKRGQSLKVIFLNDGPGLLLGSMWRDYSDIEKSHPASIKVVTLRMITQRITMSWLLSKVED